jgi:hypothetical protein
MSVGVGVGVCVNEFPHELSRADSYVTFSVGVCVNEFPRELSHLDSYVTSHTVP